MIPAKAKSESQRLAAFFFMIRLQFDGYTSLQGKALQHLLSPSATQDRKT
jgi:hypothetical protein